MEHVGWVALGGGIGSALRYLVALGAVRGFGPTFPYGTWVVNIVGSFALAVLIARLPTSSAGPGIRLALTTGAMGGFTTYSTFNHELLVLFEEGRIGAAVAYGVVTVAGALAAGLGGMWLGRSV